MKIKNEGLSLKQGSEIELQSAKVACIAGLFMFGYVSFLTMSTEQNFELAWVNYLTVITPIIMFLTICLVSYFLFISVDNHSIFKRSDENLYYELPISISNAALGTSVEVPSIDGGKSKIKIPSGTQHGKQFRLKGKGMPVLRRTIYGDLYIRVVTQVPTSLSKRQKEILEEFNEIESNKPDPVIKSFFEKAKKFWKKT